jgi:flagellin-like protein
VSEVIGAILLVAMTLTAGVILWNFHIRTPPSPPSIQWTVRTGSGYPAWGDPSDCAPIGFWTYPLTAAEANVWGNDWEPECYFGETGNFSTLNTSQVIITSHSPTNIPIADITFTFICNNASSTGGRTVLVTGPLSAMLWFPGVSTSPAPNAPHLGWCGNFDAGQWSGVPGLLPADGTLYNRLGMFVPINQNYTMLANGDTFVLYIHYGGFPLDYLCVAVGVGLYPSWVCPNGLSAIPVFDYDDYHGAPPWCFTTPNACVIQLTYTGNPATLLASIPVNSLAPATY